ncbi:hypothetical protein HF324_18420 [Chitinophaga oryzae]|uniref:Uncharacterized protein n=1 Tax=Chitinophaga oryzae TaxID=2725414 RepID=A0ABX6LHY4_9BACT|nr:hypothetical protein [Chitinophaga oryzae]QJB39724.1 hypothetical protein HF324_18420 [Chitinophaga oryzae]
MDLHFRTPAAWRVEIWPREGSPAINPQVLAPAEVPLVLEYMNSDESKRSWIVGRKATIRYAYSGEPGVPSPAEFFDRDERYHQVRIYKNNRLDGIYYIKPDSSRRPYAFPPYEVELAAVDGLAFAKGTNFGIYDGGKVRYDHVTLHETLVTRSLNKAVGYPVALNVVNTLRPENLPVDSRLLTGMFAHTDMFYDFVDGPKSIYEVFGGFCKSFYARLFLAAGQAWFIRTPDLYQNSISADQYAPDGAGTMIPIPGILKRIGPNPDNAHGIPIRGNADLNRMPAVKKATFNVTYKAINQLQNYDWSDFSNGDFAHWERPNPDMIVQRAGTGTIQNPYRLFMPYPQPSSVTMSIQQYTPADSVSQGDIVTCSFRYKWGNTTSFNIIIKAGELGSVGGGEYWTLDQSGDWKYTEGVEPGYITISRSGKKQEGSFDIKSKPIPYLINRPFPIGRVRIQILPAESPPPLNPGDHPLDPGEPTGVSVYLIKLGISPLSATGRELTITNNAEYSHIQERDDFKFIDTGVKTLSNTLFVGTAPARNWRSSKVGIIPRDIEQHMAQANVDEYAKSVDTFEGTVYSNSIEFYNIFTVDGLQGRFMQLRDKYDVRKCEHALLLEEILPEQGAGSTYKEKDTDDEN